MAIEFDHLFICTDADAPVADRLVALGLTEGSSNVHPGQGTANRRFFFDNATVEFLWVHDPEEAQSEPIQRTQLWERWRDRTDVCPFGLCVRSTEAEPIAFDHWPYRPPYLPDTLSIAVGTNSDRLTEPMLFQTPFGRRPDQFPTEKRQPLKHSLGVRNITRVEVVGPMGDLSPELQAIRNIPHVHFKVGSEYYVTLGFDQEQKGQCIDLRPDLPLIMKW